MVEGKPPDSRVGDDPATLARQALVRGDVELLDYAIEQLRSGSARTDLATALLSRFDMTRDGAALREAITTLREVNAERPGRSFVLSNLGLGLVRAFELTDDLPTLSEAISLLRAAVDDQSDSGEAPHPSRLSNLGLALVRWAERIGRGESVAEAIQRYTVAADLLSNRPADRAAVLANLGAAQLLSYRFSGDTTALTAAVEAHQQAVVTVPREHPTARTHIAGLGAAVAASASARGDVASLVAAIDTLTTAVAGMTHEDTDGSLILDQLAKALQHSFALTGDTTALAQAIECRRKALARIEPRHPDRLHYQANLALSLRHRFEVEGELDDLEDAHDLIVDVIAKAPEDHAERLKWRADLAHILHRLGIHERDADCLRDAAQILRGVVAGTTAKSPDAAMHRANLGGVLLTSLEIAWDGRVYGEAIEVLNRGLDDTAAEHSVRGALLLNIGLAHLTRFRVEQTPEPYHEAALAFGAAVASSTAPTRIRAMAAQHQGALRSVCGDHGGAVAAFGTALELLDLIAWRGLARTDQERGLAEFGGLASAAAASAIELGDHDGAVGLLEQGRGVLLARFLELRGSNHFPVLADELPELARQLAQVYDAMETGAADAEADAVLMRQQLAVRRDELLATIRDDQRFVRFLRPPAVSVMRNAATDRAVVAVNVSAHRSDALITTFNGTTAIRLPDLSAATAAAWATKFLDAVNANTWGTNDIIRETLAWLWDVAVGPVLAQLGATEGTEPHTKLWWMPTGSLSLLPLHAAGHHGVDDGDARSALHRVISSYTPTLRALSPVGAAPSRKGTTLVVGAGAGAHPLAEVATESDMVVAHRSGQVVELIGRQATKTAVIAEMSNATWVHVAGHARTDPHRPSNSHLVLHDGTLRVVEISALKSDPRELAYLSACETAAGGDRLPDEAIHIASAFQLAGFREVVATLWRVPDRAAADMATTVYSLLNSTSPDHAVNIAARRQRAKYRANAYEWAGFVHSGAGQMTHHLQGPRDDESQTHRAGS